MKQSMATGKTLQIQSVLFHNNPDDIIRSIQSLAKAVDSAITEGIFSDVTLSYGDGSIVAVFSEEEQIAIAEKFRNYMNVTYKFYGENLGSARGHNVLAQNVVADYILIMNPDVIVAPDIFKELIKPFEHKDTGIVEARQIPIEHHKDYNILTGETGWASTACALFPSTLFRQLNGFDADTFFLYCDDVDFSWRMRLLGYKIIYQPSAVVFHDKKLTKDAGWIASSAERYYSAEAALLMAYKWSRSYLVKLILIYFKLSSEEHYLKAAKAFERRRNEGKLPKQIDSEHKIGQFIDGQYARKRYRL